MLGLSELQEDECVLFKLICGTITAATGNEYGGGILDFPGGSDGKESACYTWVPDRGTSQAYSPWGRKESDKTEQLTGVERITKHKPTVPFLSSFLDLRICCRPNCVLPIFLC